MQNRIEMKSGAFKAVFLRREGVWTPDWFYENGRPLLRFKDHEWLALGRVVRVTGATRARRVGRGCVFAGRADVLGCRVDWSVRVTPDEAGFFRIRSEIRPRANIELVEALTTFETPCDYDGTERSETVIGANPATVWEGRRRLTEHYFRNPAWCYRRQEAAYHTYDCHLPVLAHQVCRADGTRRLCVAVLGNFNVCDYHDLFAQPTRTVFKDSPDYGDMKRGDTRGYKYIVGAVNWSSAYVKDPNILVPPAGVRQELLVTASAELPGGTMDAWLLRCWGVSNRLHGNAGRALPVARVYKRAGASWKKAGAWLQQALIHPGATDMVHPEQGPVDYVIGTRPLADWCYGKGWRQYLSRHLLSILYYRTQVLGQPAEREALAVLERRMLERGWVRDPGAPDFPTERAKEYETLAALTPESVIAGRVRPRSAGDMGVAIAAIMDNPDFTPGVQAQHLLALSATMTRETFDALWREPLRAIGRALATHYWEFSYMPRSKMHINGGQTAVSTLFRTAELLGRAHRISGDPAIARDYARCINLAVGWGYHTYNGDAAEDFDFRGLAHASVAGRDQMADVPPMENSHFATALAWLDRMPAEVLRPEWFDCLWLGMQTGLCQYPAARTTKRLYTPGYGRTILPLDTVATECHLRAQAPYMGYENPYDQTLVATYQSLQGLTADLFFGGALADAGPNALCLVPRAARLDRAEVTERRLLLYNPRPVAQTVRPRAYFPGGRVDGKTLRLAPRAWRWVTLRAP